MKVAPKMNDLTLIGAFASTSALLEVRAVSLPKIGLDRLCRFVLIEMDRDEVGLRLARREWTFVKPSKFLTTRTVVARSRLVMRAPEWLPFLARFTLPSVTDVTRTFF